MVVDGIFDPVYPNWIHRLFWNPISIEGGAKCRDLSITKTDKVPNAVGNGYTPTYNTFNLTKGDQWAPINEGDAPISERDSHFWSHRTGFNAGNIDRASNSTSTTSCPNSTTRSAANSNTSAPVSSNATTNPSATPSA